jgi:membrane protease YdiL (CAAX protease family)
MDLEREARSGRRQAGLRWLRWCVIDEARARPRLLLRLAAHTLAVLLGDVAAALLAGPVGGATWGREVALAFHTAVVIVATWASARWLDRRAPGSLLGAFDRRAAAELAFGAALGSGLIAAVALAELALGAARYAPLSLTGASLARALTAGLFFVAVALEEELWFRAYPFTNIAETLAGRLGDRASRGVALAVTAAAFGLAHAFNPNAGLLSTLNVAFGGVLLGVSYALTARLWIAFGLHFTWNTAQCFLDMPVSGQTLYGGLFFERVECGEDRLTGGAFGPEGGLVGLAAMAVGTVLCVLHASFLSGAVTRAPRGARSKLAPPARS